MGRLQAEDNLAENFQNPPLQARPWVYWAWLHADSSPAIITRDLEEMKAKGIVGCILYDTGAGNLGRVTQKMVLSGDKYEVVHTDDFKTSHVTPVPTGQLRTWSPRWRELVCFAAKEAGRLGIKLVVSDGLANTSGPISDEYGEQKLVWASQSVHGPAVFNGPWPEPDNIKSYHREVAVLAFPDKPDFTTDKVVNLTGQSRWNIPEGSWKILHFVQVATGAHNDWGYYTDSMSAKALDKTWEVTMAPLLQQMTAEERRGLVGIEDDSWESGRTEWTAEFLEEFKARRSYDLTPYLPILAGTNMENTNVQTQVLQDYRLTISDLIADYHYGHLKKLANENGLTCYSEAAGPHLDQADLLKTCSRVDVAMAEFWMPSYHRPTMKQRFLLRNAAMANHIYGKNMTMCESFTSFGPEWEETPFTMKQTADQAFCDGLNRVCFHAYSHSPSLTAKPGYVYYAGTHYDRNITWWDESPAFNDYISRCSFLLQEGHFVADALYYVGDGIGAGEPMKQIPDSLGEGYDHDDCNSEVLLTRTKVEGCRIVLPDGMSYPVLVLPSNMPMRLEALEKIATLFNSGANVVGPPPTGLAGMPLHVDDKKRFDSLVAQLWNDAGPKSIPLESPRALLEKIGVQPDFEQTGMTAPGTIDWIHRRSPGADIYFVCSRWEEPQKIECSFRVAGKQPELWDPVTGNIRDAGAFHQINDRTIVPLEFGPQGSIFVVFRKPIAKGVSGPAFTNYPKLEPIETLTGPWVVNFDTNWGGPHEIVFDELTDWTNRPEDGIKHYSGTAVYHKEFQWKTELASGQRVLLDLGEIHEVAHVRLNEKDLGTVWTKPGRVDITDTLRTGQNDLAITVVNLWPNRLIKDESLPGPDRKTETNMHKFGADSPLWPSGLIGPVALINEQF